MESQECERGEKEEFNFFFFLNPFVIRKRLVLFLFVLLQCISAALKAKRISTYLQCLSTYSNMSGFFWTADFLT